MPQMFWFLVGLATSMSAMLLFTTMRRRVRGGVIATDGSGAVMATARRPALDAAERAELQLARSVLDETSRDLEALAQSLGDQLATLATSIEGHAQLLCEAVGDPHRVVERGEWLWSSVQHLRLFSEKILSFAQVGTLEVRPLSIRPFLSGLAQELEDTGRRLQVEVQTSEFLPRALASERALRNATRFLVDTLLHLETRARRLYLRAYAKVTDDQDTRVELELCAEAEESGSCHDAERHSVQLGYIAARNLLEAMDAHLSFDELEGLSVTCFVSLPAAESPEEFPAEVQIDAAPFAVPELDLAERVPVPDAEPHDFGGVLVLEHDPSIRELIAVELADTDRNLITCVDGASARSLLEATPERFELLVLEHDARVESGSRIARFAAERIPGLKILLLATGERTMTEPLPEGAVLRTIVKPFGVMELRAAFHDLLGTPATTD